MSVSYTHLAYIMYENIDIHRPMFNSFHTYICVTDNIMYVIVCANIAYKRFDNGLKFVRSVDTIILPKIFKKFE